MRVVSETGGQERVDGINFYQGTSWQWLLWQFGQGTGPTVGYAYGALARALFQQRAGSRLAQYVFP